MAIVADEAHRDVTEIISGHFRQGRGYAVRRPDGTGDWLLIYTLGGAGRIATRDEGETIVRRGDAVLYRPGVYQDYATAPIGPTPRWELLWAHFQPRTAWLDWLDWPRVGDVGFIRPSQPEALATVERPLRAMVRHGRSARQRVEAFALNALELALLQLDQLNPAGPQGGVDARLRRAMEACCQRLRHPWTVAALADVAMVSPSRFAHLFRLQVGTTPLRYVEKQRLARAAQLLQRSSLSVKEIAHEVGFASPFYFSLRFKAETGASPRAFRT